jgi:hypothetical protein
MSQETSIADEARSLAAMNLEALRARWRALWGPPPRLRSPELLRHLVAWRFQAEHLGGLDAKVVGQLRRRGDKGISSPSLGEGVLISREWQGRRYDVRATGDRYLYNGVTYRSLSAVAREITGVRWNGPKFFGLRGDPSS